MKQPCWQRANTERENDYGRVQQFCKMVKEKHVTTTCYSGGNEFPRCLRYNYFSSHIINIRMRRIEKND